MRLFKRRKENIVPDITYDLTPEEVWQKTVVDPIIEEIKHPQPINPERKEVIMYDEEPTKEDIKEYNEYWKDQFKEPEAAPNQVAFAKRQHKHKPLAKRSESIMVQDEPAPLGSLKFVGVATIDELSINDLSVIDCEGETMYDEVYGTPNPPQAAYEIPNNNGPSLVDMGVHLFITPSQKGQIRRYLKIDKPYVDPSYIPKIVKDLKAKGYTNHDMKEMCI